MEVNLRIVVGISGASGAFLGVEVLRALRRQPDIEIHLIISRLAEETIKLELGIQPEEIHALADFVHSNNQLGATVASGSFRIAGMIIVPCSMKTLAGIATGYSENLLLRAADVCIKERRKLVVVPRETPLSGIHLRNMLTLNDLGVVVLPAMMTFYHKPDTIQEMVDQLVGKILLQFDIPFERYEPWGGLEEDL
jgi:4-hydroxy-3-polyprenylbenzoate decarboxylase